jgi:hypothetical protein
MLKLSCILTGDDYQLVKTETPGSKKKILLMASCLLIPTFLWFINGYLLVTQVLSGTLQNAITTGIFCALFIFLIERAIIMSRGKKGMMWARFFMGLMAALLGSMALDEVIFKSDIDTNIPQYKLARLTEEKKNLEQVYTAEIDKQSQLVDSKYSVWQKSLNDVIKEADGSGGSGKRGVSSITKIKQAICDQQQVEYQVEYGKLSALKNELLDKGKANAKEYESNFNSNAILLRIKVLYDLITKDGLMLGIYIVFFLFVAFLEFTVILIKLCHSDTNYELKIDRIEEIGRKRMEKITQNDQNSFNPNIYSPLLKTAYHEIKKPSPAIF